MLGAESSRVFSHEDGCMLTSRVALTFPPGELVSLLALGNDSRVGRAFDRSVMLS